MLAINFYKYVLFENLLVFFPSILLHFFNTHMYIIIIKKN